MVFIKTIIKSYFKPFYKGNLVKFYVKMKYQYVMRKQSCASISASRLLDSVVTMLTSKGQHVLVPVFETDDVLVPVIDKSTDDGLVRYRLWYVYEG